MSCSDGPCDRGNPCPRQSGAGQSARRAGGGRWPGNGWAKRSLSGSLGLAGSFGVGSADDSRRRAGSTTGLGIPHAGMLECIPGRARRCTAAPRRAHEGRERPRAAIVRPVEGPASSGQCRPEHGGLPSWFKLKLGAGASLRSLAPAPAYLVIGILSRKRLAGEPPGGWLANVAAPCGKADMLGNQGSKRSWPHADPRPRDGSSGHSPPYLLRRRGRSRLAQRSAGLLHIIG